MNRTWRLILLIVALIFMIWPDLFPYANWVAIIAVILLLIGEFTCGKCCKTGVVKKVALKKKAKKRKR